MCMKLQHGRDSRCYNEHELPGVVLAYVRDVNTAAAGSREDPRKGVPFSNITALYAFPTSVLVIAGRVVQ